ncbi:hypothetical protein SUGI_1169120 [Cryptomeria japonica]|uniref:uncharacterized protein LOC131068727 isoform X1 n=1 Tax=Cryptomeria japonica TaxID=3369 RepID=UPI002414B99A|nr:uncharacterized protein LOC131068727 isoform X1 [Cryptomeria japonica]XP_057859966.1 uncharacterized protein LOC131068727 isoform X1 [Cryptomeria japonica]XP_057859972.1 uncharacterized protein LOC131068727 isoform X1 [Cryptomeria japonica]XP_059069857.1 uncharacterized protein LOC131068727 isoform X1 [Cryptomeria japonica]GLJ54435.1 hypothetical protein SUGI_1169120 [Cryptomeria japonica]
MQEKYAKKQVSVATKLLVLLFVGLSGICLCYMNIDQRNSIRKSRRFLPSDNRENVVTCQLQTDHSIPTHYPQPTSYNRKECSCTPVHNFVILSMQRSGSGWFETLLNSHPNISSHGEVFLDEKKRKNFASIKKVLDAIYNLEWKSSASKKECTAAVGFKWMLNQGAMEYNKEALAYFKQKNVSIIFLFRHNLLRRYVSILANVYDKEAKLLNGTHQSHVHSSVEAQILATFKPVVNVTLLPLYLRRVEELCHDAIVSFRSTRHKTVSYEDLVKNSLHVLEIQKFLGVIPKKLTSHHVKIHTEPLSKQIQNWKEVYHRLKGTEFDEFLHDY